MNDITTIDMTGAARDVHHRGVVRQVALGGAAVVGLDQLSKAGATSLDHSSVGAMIDPGLNRAYSLGIVAAPPAVLIAGTVVAVVAAGTWSLRATLTARTTPWAPALVIGGSLSNLLDRTIRGGVLDFIATPWIVLNLADIAVVAGLACLARRPPPDGRR